MKVFFKIFLVLFFFICSSVKAKEFLYILNDECINDLYDSADVFFKNSPILIVRDTMGIILRFEIGTAKDEYEKIDTETLKNLLLVKDFLSKFENLVIISVHTEKISQTVRGDLKGWEFSTVIANAIEDCLLNGDGKIDSKRIKSVGYGEFLPQKNTPYNGGKYHNRVDIMILCNISGE